MKCEKCGAEMKEVEGTNMMKCEACGHEAPKEEIKAEEAAM